MWAKEIFLLLSVTCSLISIEAGDTPITPIPTECPSTDPKDSTVHIQHESDCTKFYTCAHGTPVLTLCPGGLHFNPLLQVCDWPDRAGCTSGQTTNAPSSTTTKSTTTKSTTTEATTPKATTTKATTTKATTTKATTTKPTTTTTQGPPSDWDKDCPWPDPLNHTVHLPHEDDCEKFYKCDNGKKVEFTCPDNLHFNKELEVCDWPWDAGCDDSAATTSTETPTTISSTTTQSTTTEATTTEATTTEATTTEPTTTTTQGPPSDWDKDCPWPDPLNHTVHLPHEDDCEKFYKCDNGKKVEFTCPDNLHFNKELEVCDWPWDAGCDDSAATTSTETPTTISSTTTQSTTTEATTTEATTTEATTPEPTTTTTQGPPSDWDKDCPWPDPLNHTVHLPHEDDCEKFYKCDNGKKVEFTCPDNLHFNKELEVCDWPWDAGCDDSAATTSTETPTTISSTTTQSTTTEATTTEATTTEVTTTEATTPEPTTTTTQGPPSDWDKDCPWPDPLNHTVHLPHEDDCEKFYKCDNGKKVEFTCPDNLHFNKELEVCDWPWDAGCDDSAATTSTETPTTISSTTTQSTTTEATTTEATTTEATTTEATTPEPTTTTTQGPPSDWDKDCPWPDPLNHTVHLPHEDDCEKFYKCDNGKKVEFTCPDNLHFNKELEVCDWPWDAGCDDSAATTSTETPTSISSTTTQSTTTEATTTEATTTEATTTEATTPEPTTTTTQGPPSDWDKDCPWPDPLNHTVHLPHEDDCEKFYKCDNGKKVEFICPDNLHFNKELEVCDWPWDAGCDDSAATTSTETPTTISSTTTQSTTTEATTTEATTTEATTTEATTPEPTTTTTQGPPSDWDKDCPWPDPLNHTVHLPHEDDCEKFYKCDNGKKVEFICPDNLHFNKGLEVCDWPWDAGCDNTTIPTTTQVPTTTTQETNTGTLDECEGDQLLEHECECDKYYVCENGEKILYVCEDESYYIPEIQKCGPINLAPEKCQNNTQPGSSSSAAPTTTTEETFTPTESTTANDNDDDSSSSTSTTASSTTEEDSTPSSTQSTTESTTEEGNTPSSTESTTESTNEEDTTSSSTTTEAPQCQPSECDDTTIYLPVSNNPRNFIRCVKGVEVLGECPNNLVFDKVLKVCNLAHLASV